MSEPYLALLRLAEREAGLVGDGRFEELEHLAAERAAIVGALPATPPAGARPALERAAALQAATSAALQTAMARCRAEFHTLERGRDATRAYGRAA